MKMNLIPLSATKGAAGIVSGILDPPDKDEVNITAR